MKKIFIITSILLITVSMHAQRSCDENTLKKATELYEIGNFEEMRSNLDSCMDYFSNSQKVQAYRLICMSQLTMGDMEEAKKSVQILLKYDPDYTPDKMNDLPVFEALVNSEKDIMLYEYDEKIISVSKREQKISEAPGVVSTLDANAIRIRGYKSVAEALNSIPGLDVIEDYLSPNVGVRGINGGNRASSRIIKVMINEQPVSFRPGSENYLGPEFIPIEMVEKIEIIRGPNSSLYGANAYLGVVNIITKSTDAYRGSMSVSSGVYNNRLLHSEELVFAHNYKNLNFIIGYANRYFDRSGMRAKDMPGRIKYDTIPQNKTLGDISKPKSAFAKFYYYGKKKNRFDLDISYQRLITSAQFIDWGFLEKKNKIDLYNLYSRASYKQELSDKWDLVSTLTFSHGEPAQREELHASISLANYQSRKVGYSAIDVGTNVTRKINEKDFISLGFDLSAENQKRQTYYMHTDSTVIPTGDELKDTLFNNIGVYLQTSFHPFKDGSSTFQKHFELVAGIRYDYHNIYKSAINYRGGILYRISNSLFGKLLVGTSFKSPSSTQLYSTPIAPGDQIGNSELKPEKAMNFDFVLGGNIGEKINFIINGYYSEIKDKVEIVPFQTNLMASNSAEITSMGVEAEVKYISLHLRSFLNYSQQFSFYHRTDVFSGNKYYNTTDLYPTIMIKGGIDYTIFKPSITFYLEGKYIGERSSSPQNRSFYDPVNYQSENETIYKLDNYLLFDLSISTYAIRFMEGKKTAINLKVSNLLNTKYYYPGFKDYDIPGLGRLIEMKVTQFF